MMWVTMNLEDGNRLAYVGNSKSIACRVAEALVGNHSGANTGEIVLYGRGDGTTSVMVRQLPIDCIGPPTWDKAVSACEAVLADLHCGEDGFWRGGAAINKGEK